MKVVQHRCEICGEYKQEDKIIKTIRACNITGNITVYGYMCLMCRAEWDNTFIKHPVHRNDTPIRIDGDIDYITGRQYAKDNKIYKLLKDMDLK